MAHHPIPHKISRIIPWEGRDYRYFSGTAYLGMGSVDKFEKLILEGIKKYGPNHGASRFSNVQLEVYEELEAHFAHGAGAPQAALLSSGFMAGYLAQQLLCKDADEIWAAPDAHPAILPGDFLHDTSRSFGEFASSCVQKSFQTTHKNVVILANAVDTILPAVHDFEWVKKLNPKNSYQLLVDDSHAFGLLGRSIYGTFSMWKHLPVALTVAGSLGKALAIPAGIILGSASFVGKVKNSPVFRGASPAAPGYCEAFLKATSLYAQQQQQLAKNLTCFFAQLKSISAETRYVEQYPVVTFCQSGWAPKLLKQGIMISSFSYPRPEDAPVDRIVLSAYHTTEDLMYLAAAISSS